MGILPTPNHLALIRDCYPPHNSSAPTAQSDGELPHPVSNAVSKLAFYAVNRPAKLPKVVGILADRAARAKGQGGQVRNRSELAVTCDILRTLVTECAESGHQGSAELVKSALAEPALSVAEMALGGGGTAGGTSARPQHGYRQQGQAVRVDPELEARGASLFHTVATFTTPPFFGFGAAARQYQQCITVLSYRAQLTSPDHSRSRYVAMKGLQGAARSDVVFATGSDFERQVGQIAPALFCTCIASSSSDLDSTALDSNDLSALPASLRSRKSQAISPPEDGAQASLHGIAVPSLAYLSRHATVPQLLVLHDNLLAYLEQGAPASESDGAAPESRSVTPSVHTARILVAAAPDSHRSPALSWWADRAAESTDPDRTVKLLETLGHLLEDEAVVGKVGLNANGILFTLEEVLLRQARVEPDTAPAAGERRGAVEGAVLSTVAALVRSARRNGYPSQMDDLASNTIVLLHALGSGDSNDAHEPIEDARVERVTAGMSAEARVMARRSLVAVLGVLVDPSSPLPTTYAGAPRNASAPSIDGDAASVKHAEPPVQTVAEGDHVDVHAVATDAPGLTLGAPVGEVNPTRDAAPAPSETIEPVVVVHSPDGSEARADTVAPADQPTQPDASASSERTLSPYVFSRSLYLLADPDADIRSRYARVLATFLRQVGRTPRTGLVKTAEAEAFWNRFVVAFYEAVVRAETEAEHFAAQLGELAEAAWGVEAGSAVVAGVPMLLALRSDATAAESSLSVQVQAGRSGLAQVGRTWKVSTTAGDAEVIAALSSEGTVQAATEMDAEQLRHALSAPWDLRKAKVAGAGLHSPYLSGAPPARSLVQLSLSRSRANSQLRLPGSAPRTPPSLSTSGHGSNEAATAAPGGTSGGTSPIDGPGGAAAAAGAGRPPSVAASALALRRLQTPSLADLQAAAKGSPSRGAGAGSSPARSVASSTVGSQQRRRDKAVSLDAAGASSIIGGDSPQRRRRTGRQSVESVLERVGRKPPTGRVPAGAV